MPRAATSRSSDAPAIRCGNAFTLLETVLSVAVMAVILGAIAMTMVSASSAINAGRDENARRAAAAGVLSEAAEELRTAVRVVERSATGIAVEVPDRTGDGLAEIIRYEWPAGLNTRDALRRRVNDGPWRSLPIQGVAVETATRVVPAPARPTRAGVTFASHVAVSGGASAEIQVGPDGHVAQYVRPAFGPIVNRWRPERVRLSARRSLFGAGKALLVTVVRASPGFAPGGEVVGVATISEGDVGLVRGWVSVNLQSTAWVPAGEGVVVCVRSVDTNLLSLDLGNLSGGLLNLGGGGSVLNLAEPTDSTSSSGAIHLEFETGGNSHNGLSMLRSASGRSGAWALQASGTDLMIQLTGSVEEVAP